MEEGDPLTAILGTAPDTSEPTDPPSGNTDATPPADASPLTAKSSQTFTGSVSSTGQYQLFDLGAGEAGDYWTISLRTALSGPFVVVLLDVDDNLLQRTYVSAATPLRHILRESTGQVHLGIMPPASGGGGNFTLKATLQNGQSVPASRRQVVWVNFAGGDNVSVHHRDPVSFGPFDGAMVGDEYADHTRDLKDVILREMRADYAAYNVVILSSDDGPPPDGPHSVVHFGGDESGLLGLADSVDNYNQELTQNAIVYVDNFAIYWTMALEPDEMGVMIANVASHELGHLLGLYHTRDPDDLMDTTGSAWDLADNQSFHRSPLEPTVFATGWEDSPRLLAQIVGSNPDAGKSATRQKCVKAGVYKAIRRFTQEELTSRCGTCLSLAHE
jgi:hypothetical protein